MIGILEAGAPPDELGCRESYAAMFQRLLGAETPTQTFSAHGELPPPAMCNGWLITGSNSAAYDEEEWITALVDFVRNIPSDMPLVGVCFGHQLMARAFGGTVARSARGRALGLLTYSLRQHADWMDAASTISLPVGHADQVAAVGPDFSVLAESEFTPYAMLAYSGKRAVSVQAHPEFTIEFARALIELRREEVGDAAADQATGSLAAPHDCERVGGWLRRFLTVSRA